MDFFCSLESLEAEEDLAGSAPRADVWFLLEYSGKWAHAAFKESSIPDDVKDYVNGALAQIPESRLLLVKNDQQREGIAFFAALAAVDAPLLYRFELKDYNDLLALDLVALARGDAAFDAQRSEEPVFVICTTGLRDRCCALHGVAAYQALAAAAPGQVWESTHHGGHRFAANLLQMPQGLSYGRLRADSALGVLDAARQGRLALAHLRGRSRLAEPQQAAEILLRRQLDLDAEGALAFKGAGELSPDSWEVRFDASGQEHVVALARQETGRQVHLSCGVEELGPVVQYQLIEESPA